MPTPIGHAIAGLAVGWGVAGVADTPRARVVQAACLGALAAAPDLDLIFGHHSGETHSVGAAAIAATVAALVRLPIARRRWLIWLAAFAAWASHPLCDSLAPDNSPPIGVMLFWPFTHAYFISGLSIFEPIWRTITTWRELRHDLLALLKELVILGPLAAVAWRVRRHRPPR